MPKCNFNKVALQLYGNLTLVWMFSCKFAAYFQNTFFQEHLWTTASAFNQDFRGEVVFIISTYCFHSFCVILVIHFCFNYCGNKVLHHFSINAAIKNNLSFTAKVLFLYSGPNGMKLVSLAYFFIHISSLNLTDLSK